MIIATSDWHLGNGGHADDSNPDGIRWAVEAGLDMRPGIFAVLGDLGEGWQFTWPRILKEHGPMLSWIDAECYRRDVTFFVVTGNHDRVATDKLARLLRGVMPKCFVAVSNGQAEIDSWRLIHGHQWDVFNKGKSPLLPISMAVTWIVGWPERAFPWFDEHWLNPTKWVSAARKDRALIHQMAEKWMEREGVPRLAIGHTHQIDLTRKDGRTFVNAGTLTRGHAEFVALYPDGNAVKVERNDE